MIDKKIESYTDRELIKAYVEAEQMMESLKALIPMLRKELVKRAEENPVTDGEAKGDE